MVRPLAYPNLSAEMTRYGISQKDLAEGIGRTAETVSRWMTGKNTVGTNDAFKIQRTFFPDMPIDYLFSSTPIAPSF